jgi:hypothetical protein
MKIDGYTLGSITINRKIYQKGIIVFPEKVLPNWIRIKSNSLELGDIKEIIANNPETLIIGTGAYGSITVPSSTRNALSKRRIKVIAENTKNACALFNEHIKNNIKTVGAFHLTC